MWSYDACAQYVSGVFESVRNYSGTKFSVFRERSFILTSWLLRRRAQDIGNYDDYLDHLLRLVGFSTTGELEVFLDTANPEARSNIFSAGTYIITDDVYNACQSILTHDTAYHYRVDDPIYGFEALNGYDYLLQLCGLRKGTPTLADATVEAFRNILGTQTSNVPGPVKEVKSKAWKFYCSVVISQGVLSPQEFLKVHETHLQVATTDSPVLCFCPPITEDANRTANSSSPVFYMWGGSGIVFFNRLRECIQNYGKDKARDSFLAVFDMENDRKGAYSSFMAVKRLQEKLNSENSNISTNNLKKN
jgi:hypothetical protein